MSTFRRLLSYYWLVSTTQAISSNNAIVRRISSATKQTVVACWKDMSSSTGNTGQSTASTTTMWSVCQVCKGEGKLIRPPSKKSRFRHSKRAKLSEQEQPQENTRPARVRIDGCSRCSGSGLQQDVDNYNMSYNKIPMSLPTVAIIGGGLSGLALATACRHRGIPHAVYERDAAFAVRSQGYGLTMQQASKALASFGISPQGITSTKHVVHDPTGKIVGQWGLRHWGRSDDAGEPKRKNMHIPRQALRFELLQASDNKAIHWDHRLLNYSKTQKGEIELTFQVGAEIVTRFADVVVGADGIRSAVRQQMIGDEQTPLRYLGCIVILGICPYPENLHTELLDGETVFQTADGTTRIYAMPYSQEECMWQLSFPMEEEEASSLSRQGPTALKKEALARCEKWHSPVAEVLNETPVQLISGYPVYDRSLITTELLEVCRMRSGCPVSLMGDAAHPMSPFKGQGANQGLLDALSFARALYRECLKQSDNSMVAKCLSAIKEYEQEMVVRSAVKVKASAEAAHFLHTEAAIREGDITRGAASREANASDHDEST